MLKASLDLALVPTPTWSFGLIDQLLAFEYWPATMAVHSWANLSIQYTPGQLAHTIDQLERVLPQLKSAQAAGLDQRLGHEAKQPLAKALELSSLEARRRAGLILGIQPRTPEHR